MSATLLEVVAKVAEAARACLLNALDLGFTEARSHVIAGHINAMESAVRAAYDAAKVEPTITHAALAAVVESYYTECEGSREGDGAREVLRRVTGGLVPRVFTEARVVEVLGGIIDWCRGVGVAPWHVTAVHAPDCATCGRVRLAAQDLGLALPGGNPSTESNGSGGGNPPESPESLTLASVPGFAMPPPAIQEAIRTHASQHRTPDAKAEKPQGGALHFVWAFPHEWGYRLACGEAPAAVPETQRVDTLQAWANTDAARMCPMCRANVAAQTKAGAPHRRAPTPPPEVPPLAPTAPTAPSCRRPDPLEGPTCATLGCGERGADKPCQWPAQPEPAAPEVVWEGKGVRVLEDGTIWFLWAGKWRLDYNAPAAQQQFARALAEAKREVAALKPRPVREAYSCKVCGRRLLDALPCEDHPSAPVKSSLPDAATLVAWLDHEQREAKALATALRAANASVQDLESRLDAAGRVLAGALHAAAHVGAEGLREAAKAALQLRLDVLRGRANTSNLRRYVLEEALDIVSRVSPHTDGPSRG